MIFMIHTVEQADALIEGGADFIIIETIIDVQENACRIISIP